MSAFSIIEQNSLGFKLTPISLRDLFFISEIPCNLYGVTEGLFTVILKKQTLINKNVLRDLIESGHSNIFVLREDFRLIKELQQNNLRQVTRGLSIGDPVNNSRKQIGLLTVCMGYLYDTPIDDDALNLQYQSAKNLGLFLIENLSLHPVLYKEVMKQKHHYVLTQPLISSLFLIGVLKQSHLYNDKEIETLFVTSYFKDIGMSSIPIEKYDLQKLSPSDKLLFSNHPKQSVEILNSRLGLSGNYLKIIENHHSFSKLGKESGIKLDPKDKVISGFETRIICIMDIIAAMISFRPFRKEVTLYQALEHIKNMISLNHPQEFKMIVNYFKQFFKK